MPKVRPSLRALPTNSRNFQTAKQKKSSQNKVLTSMKERLEKYIDLANTTRDENLKNHLDIFFSRLFETLYPGKEMEDLNDHISDYILDGIDNLIDRDLTISKPKYEGLKTVFRRFEKSLIKKLEKGESSQASRASQASQASRASQASQNSLGDLVELMKNTSIYRNNSATRKNKRSST